MDLTIYSLIAVILAISLSLITGPIIHYFKLDEKIKEEWILLIVIIIYLTLLMWILSLVTHEI
jgi:hypothetical protein